MKKQFAATVKILAAVLLILAMFPIQALAAGGSASRREVSMRYLSNWPSGPDINSRSAILIELNSGEILFAKNEDEKRYPASITKVMTALLAIENCDMNAKVTFSHAAVTDLEEGGYNGYYKEGEVLTVEQCLYGLLLESVNECGYALAEHIAGSVPAFAEMMNARAAELGCVKTHFNNPHGLNDENHYTCAHDMAKIFWACLQNEKFYEIDSALSYKIDPTEKNPEGFNMTMHHKMMQSGSDYYYEGVKAGKTGYTSIAKNTLLTYAERDGVELLCVVMKGDGGGMVYSDTKALLNYGFNNFSLFDMTEDVTNFVTGLNLGNAMPVKLEGSSVFFLPKGTDSVVLSLEKKGAFDENGTIGNLVFTIGEEKLTALPLVIDEEALKEREQTQPQETESAAEGQTGESKEGSTKSSEETEPSSEAIPTRKESKSGGLRTVLLIVLAVVVVAAAIWVVLRRIKINRIRAQKRKEILERFRSNKSE